MFFNRVPRGMVFIFIFLLFSSYVLEMDAWARFGGGRSMGSRGSRSFSMPRSPSSVPTSPSRPYNSPAPGPTGSPIPQQPGGGFLRGIAGGIMGGMLGGMLFRGLGFGSNGMGGSGFGLFEIVLIGLILYGICWFIKNKRRQDDGSSRPENFREAPLSEHAQQGPLMSQNEPQAAQNDIDTGLYHIRQMDHTFDERQFHDACMDNFFKIQGAWANRDMLSIRPLLTGEMLQAFQKEAEELKRNRRINRLENIAVRSVDITEAWQEEGKDFITVRFYANLLDYTVDETTGQAISGSKTDPVKFEEYWTFSRSVGSNPWQLSAITQASKSGTK